MYLGDIFIFSDTIKGHQEHVELVINHLYESKMVLNLKKCDFLERINCLGDRNVTSWTWQHSHSDSYVIALPRQPLFQLR